MLSQILSNDELRPIIIGSVVAVIGYFATTFLKKKQGDDERVRKRDAVRKHPFAVRVTYALGIIGIMSALVFYGAGIFPDNDWRGAGLGVGLMMFLPTVWVAIYWQVTGIRLRSLIDEINGESSFSMFVFMYSLFNIIGISAVISLVIDWLR